MIIFNMVNQIGGLNLPSKDLRLVWLFHRTVDVLLAAGPTEHQLSTVQFFALRFIGLHERPNLGDVAQALGISNAAATKLIDRLVKKGLVNRVEDPTDRRERRLGLTKRGEEFFTTITKAGGEHIALVLGRLSRQDRTALRQGLEAFLAANLADPAVIRRVCLRCGREHELDCPGEGLYRRLGGPPRPV